VVAAAGSACSGRGPGAGGTGGLQRSGDATTRWLLLPSSLGDESGPVSPWSSVGGGGLAVSCRRCRGGASGSAVPLPVEALWMRQEQAAVTVGSVWKAWC
jgi:hypothetical protein